MRKTASQIADEVLEKLGMFIVLPLPSKQEQEEGRQATLRRLPSWAGISTGAGALGGALAAPKIIKALELGRMGGWKGRLAGAGLGALSGGALGGFGAILAGGGEARKARLRREEMR